ncbi:MAG: hypothetical protein HY302_16995 [Opitutae bacterium]|nr:hypothetical protein [Opitutae bacterium]
MREFPHFENRRGPKPWRFFFAAAPRRVVVSPAGESGRLDFLDDGRDTVGWRAERCWLASDCRLPALRRDAIAGVAYANGERIV